MSPPNPFDAIFNAFNKESITLLHSLKSFTILAIAIINSVKDKIIFNLLLFNPLITSKFTDWTNFKISFLIISNKILTKISPTFDANLIKNDLSFFAKSINELICKSKF